MSFEKQQLEAGQEERERMMAPSDLPQYALTAQPVQPVQPPSYSDYKAMQPQQQQPALPIVIGSDGRPMVPVVVNPDGTSQITVIRQNLPPRATRQYATAGFPGAATRTIQEPQDHSSVTYTQNVSLGEAIYQNQFHNGVRADIPADSNGNYFNPFSSGSSSTNRGKWGGWFGNRSRQIQATTTAAAAAAPSSNEKN